MADTIEKIHQRSRGTYGKRRNRAELLDTYEMNVNHKLVSAIMTELGISGLPRPGKRKPQPARRYEGRPVSGRGLACKLPWVAE